MEKTDNPSYYAIIPADVRYDSRLKANEKLMFGEITVLSNKYGYCIAKNKYFSVLYGVSISTVSRWIKNLEDCGYISSSVIRDSETNQVIERRVYLKRSIGSTQKSQEPYAQKDQEGLRKKRKDNSTSNNNTSTNNTRVNKGENKNTKLALINRMIENGVDESLASEFWDYRRNIIRKPLTDRALSGVINHCLSNQFDLSRALELIMERSWTGFNVQWIKNEQANNQIGFMNSKVQKAQQVADNNDMVLENFLLRNGVRNGQ